MATLYYILLLVPVGLLSWGSWKMTQEKLWWVKGAAWLWIGIIWFWGFVVMQSELIRLSSPPGTPNPYAAIPSSNSYVRSAAVLMLFFHMAQIIWGQMEGQSEPTLRLPLDRLFMVIGRTSAVGLLLGGLWVGYAVALGLK